MPFQSKWSNLFTIEIKMIERRLPKTIILNYKKGRSNWKYYLWIIKKAQLCMYIHTQKRLEFFPINIGILFAFICIVSIHKSLYRLIA